MLILVIWMIELGSFKSWDDLFYQYEISFLIPVVYRELPPNPSLGPSYPWNSAFLSSGTNGFIYGRISSWLDISYKSPIVSEPG